MTRLLLERLRVRDLRNLSNVELEPAPRVNVISGNNGHGKTSLLEAIYFAATSRSFRTSRVPELVRHGASVAFARARFVEVDDEHSPLSREQTAAIEGKKCTARIDGNKPATLSEFATRSPVVAFHPEELTLTIGPAPGRRTLLDRLALFIDPASSDHRARYTRALKARQQLLRRAAGGNLDTGDIEAFEHLCAHHGAALTRARAFAAVSLEEELLPAFRRIAAPDITLSARFEAGGCADAEEAAAELRRRRPRDAYRPSAGFGPHRDDLGLYLDGHA